MVNTSKPGALTLPKPRFLFAVWFLLWTSTATAEMTVADLMADLQWRTDTSAMLKQLADNEFVPLTRGEPIVRMVLQEANGEPFMGMVAVAAVALDRVVDSRWPDTDHKVIYQRHQFTSMAQQLRRYTNTQIITARRAVADARRGKRPCGIAYWYHATWMPQRPRWAAQVTPRCTIGNHTFYGAKYE